MQGDSSYRICGIVGGRHLTDNRSAWQACASPGVVQGADGPGTSFVYVPSLRAIITGNIVFDHVYFGVPRDGTRELVEPSIKWRRSSRQS